MTTTPTRPANAPARLDLGRALAETAACLPVMWRGSGGVMIVVTALAVLLAVVPAGLPAAVLEIGLGLTALSAFGALTRIGVAGDLAGARGLGLGPFGFQLTRTEFRLIGASLLCLLFLAIILALLALVALAMFGGAGLNARAVEARDWAAVGPVWKLALLALFAFIVIAAPVVLALRLSMFAPATVARARMISLTATGQTNGAMLPLFAGLVLVGLPKIVWLSLVLAGLLRGPAAWICGAIILAGLQAPLTSAFLGAAWRQLERPDEDLAPL